LEKPEPSSLENISSAEVTLLTQDTMDIVRVLDEGSIRCELPERFLLEGILERALMDLEPWANKEYRRDAIYWFRGRYGSDYITSYYSVVEELQLSVSTKKYILGKVREAEDFELVRLEVLRESESKGEADRKRIGKLAEREWNSRRPEVGAILRRPGRLSRHRGPAKSSTLPHRVEGDKECEVTEEHVKEMVQTT